MRTAQRQVPVQKAGKSKTPRVHLSPLKPHRREPKSCQTAAACGVRDLGSWLEQAATCSALEPPIPCVSAGQLRPGLKSNLVEIKSHHPYASSRNAASSSEESAVNSTNPK